MCDYRKYTGAKILCEKAPTGEEINRVLAERMAGRIAEHAQQEVTEENRALARRLLPELDAETAVAALIGLVAASGTKIDAAVDLNIPEPVRQPRPERRGPYGRPVQPERRGPYGRPGNPDAPGQATPRPRGGAPAGRRGGSRRSSCTCSARRRVGRRLRRSLGPIRPTACSNVAIRSRRRMTDRS